MLANTPESWGSLSKLFHWLVAILVIVQVPAGFLMSYTYGLAYHAPTAAPLHNLASQIHHTTGFAILMLVVARLAWRLSGPPPNVDAGSAAWQRRLASVVHASLYGLLLLLPLSGWAAVSVVAGEPIWLFGAPHLVPAILPAKPLDAAFGYSFYAHIHVYALWVGLALLCLHIGAAFWHHFARQDGVLRRMWPLGTSPATR